MTADVPEDRAEAVIGRYSRGPADPGHRPGSPSEETKGKVRGQRAEGSVEAQIAGSTPVCPDRLHTCPAAVGTGTAAVSWSQEL